MLFSRSVSQSISRSVSQLVSQSATQSVSQSITNHLINKSARQSIVLICNKYWFFSSLIQTFFVKVRQFNKTSNLFGHKLTTRGEDCFQHFHTSLYKCLGTIIFSWYYAIHETSVVWVTFSFHVVVRLFSYTSKMTSKCGNNKKSGPWWAAAECVTYILTKF